MPNELSPKRHFQQHDTIKKELNTVVHSDNFQFALSFALSEYVMSHAPSAEQLTGVRSFIGVLLNLPREDEKVPGYPSKTIDYSVLAPRRPEPQKTK